MAIYGANGKFASSNLVMRLTKSAIDLHPYDVDAQHQKHSMKDNGKSEPAITEE